MTPPTNDAIKTRIETLADAAITTLLTGAEYAIARSTLSAIEARPIAATREQYAARELTVARGWQLWLFVAEVIHAEDSADTLAALEACHPYLDTVPDYFFARRALEDAALANPLVYDTSPMSDSGPAINPYKGKTYACVRFTLTVYVIRTA